MLKIPAIRMGTVFGLSLIIVLMLVSVAGAATKDASVQAVGKSLLGVTVAKHNVCTTFSYDGNRLLNSPRAIAQSWWTLPPTFVSDNSKGWDWYNAVSGGTGRSQGAVTFTFGVPTPWGAVGSSKRSVILSTVRYSGTYSFQSL